MKAGLVDPFWGAMPRLDYIMRGVKKNKAVTGSSSRECLPITPVIMRQLRGVWSLSGESRDTKLIWAACCLCFFGFLRAGELTVPSNNGYDPAVHLNVGDLALDNATQPSLIRVKVKQSNPSAEELPSRAIVADEARRPKKKRSVVLSFEMRYHTWEHDAQQQTAHAHKTRTSRGSPWLLTRSKGV